MVRRTLVIFLLFPSLLVLSQTSREIGELIGLGSAFSQGVSAVDINEDGFDDLYITRRNRDNQFFINNGDASFTNIAAEAGVDEIGLSALTVWSDYDRDGDQDFFLGMEQGVSKLFINNGDLTFTNVNESTIGDLDGFVASAQWGDVNGDGWEDLFIFFLDGTNQYFFNDQNGGFENVTDDLGLIDKRLTMGAVLFDFDQDRDLDLYMTHDGFGGNHFFVNDGSGVFEDKSVELGIYTETDAMGITIGDYDNDGWEDVYLTNLYENQLFRNQEGLGFEEVGASAGVDDYGMGWGTSWIDYNNDGWLDLYAANDSYFSDYPNRMYLNKQDGSFEFGFLGEALLSEKASYATAVSDLNNDGIQEIIVANRGSVDRLEVFTFEDLESKNFISINMSSFGNGSMIKVESNGRDYSRGSRSGTSWSGEDSDWIQIGLNNAVTVGVDISFLNGEEFSSTSVSSNKYYHLKDNALEEVEKVSFNWPEDIITGISAYESYKQHTYIDKYININICKYKLFNIYTYEGILIYSNQFNSLETLDLSFLKRGVYVVKLLSDEKIRSFKIFKN